MKRTKYVTYRNLKAGQEIRGTKINNRISYFYATVKSINPSYVTINRGGAEEIVSTEYQFEVEMTQEEFKRKYRDKAQEVFDALQNRLLPDEIGYHEMWNAWVSYDPYEIAVYCIEEKITILGCCPDIIPHRYYDIGICACYNESGERFWCHFSSEMLETMKELYPEFIKTNKDEN